MQESQKNPKKRKAQQLAEPIGKKYIVISEDEGSDSYDNCSLQKQRNKMVKVEQQEPTSFQTQQITLDSPSTGFFVDTISTPERKEIVPIENYFLLQIFCRQHLQYLKQEFEPKGISISVQQIQNGGCLNLEGNCPVETFVWAKQRVEHSLYYGRAQLQQQQIRCNQDQFEDLKKLAPEFEQVQYSYTDEEGILHEGGPIACNQNALPLIDRMQHALLGEYTLNAQIVLKVFVAEKLLNEDYPLKTLAQNFNVVLFNTDEKGIPTDFLGEVLCAKQLAVRNFCERFDRQNQRGTQNSDLMELNLTQDDNKMYAIAISSSSTAENQSFKQFWQSVTTKSKRLKCCNLEQTSIAFAVPYNGLSLDQTYLRAVLRIIAHQDNNQFSQQQADNGSIQISIIVEEKFEEEAKFFFKDLCENQTLTPAGEREEAKGGEWSAIISTNSNMQQIRQNQLSNYSPGVFMEGMIADQNQQMIKYQQNILFGQELQVIIEYLFQTQNDKLHTILVSKDVLEQASFNTQMMPLEEFESKRINVKVNIQDCFEWTEVQPGIEECKLLTVSDKDSQIYCVDTEYMSQLTYERPLYKYFQVLKSIGIKEFNYERLWPELKLSSVECRIDFGNNMMHVFGQDNKVPVIYHLKRFNTPKYNHLKQTMFQKINLINQHDQIFIQSCDNSQREANNKQSACQPCTLSIYGIENDIRNIALTYDRLKKDNHIYYKMNWRRDSMTKEAQKFADKKLIKMTIFQDKSEIMIEGYRQTIVLHRRQFLDILSRQEKVECPPEWQNQSQNCQLFQISSNSQDFQQIQERFQKTLPLLQISELHRIQNIKLYKKYQQELQRLKLKGNATELQLFHGTRTNDPRLIYESEDGFDFRLSNQGSLGRGAYFAYDASYSIQYVHTKQEDTRLVQSFILANVLIGNCYQTRQDQGLARPPFLPGSDTESYDSVSSVTKSSRNSNYQQMYVVYDNCKAYPAYLIKFQDNSQRNIAAIMYSAQALQYGSALNLSAQANSKQSRTFLRRQLQLQRKMTTQAFSLTSTTAQQTAPAAPALPIAAPVLPIATPALSIAANISAPATVVQANTTVPHLQHYIPIQSSNQQNAISMYGDISNKQSAQDFNSNNYDEQTKRFFEKTAQAFNTQQIQQTDMNAVSDKQFFELLMQQQQYPYYQPFSQENQNGFPVFKPQIQSLQQNNQAPILSQYAPQQASLEVKPPEQSFQYQQVQEGAAATIKGDDHNNMPFQFEKVNLGLNQLNYFEDIFFSNNQERVNLAQENKDDTKKPVNNQQFLQQNHDQQYKINQNQNN